MGMTKTEKSVQKERHTKGKHMMFIENTETCLQKLETEREGTRKQAMCRSRGDVLFRDAQTPSQFNVVAGEDAQ